MCDGTLQSGTSGQNIAEAAARAHAERLVDAGPAKVGIDEQNSNPFCARTTAQLMLVVVLPSCGSALVTIITLGGAAEVGKEEGVRSAR